MLKIDFQLTTHVKVIPGERSLLWLEGDCGWLYSYDLEYKHSFHKSQNLNKRVHIVFFISILRRKSGQTVQFKKTSQKQHTNNFKSNSTVVFGTEYFETCHMCVNYMHET